MPWFDVKFMDLFTASNIQNGGVHSTNFFYIKFPITFLYSHRFWKFLHQNECLVKQFTLKHTLVEGIKTL